MTQQAKAELNNIKSELRKVLSDLESIYSALQSGFTGIGTERCAACINQVISQYRIVQRQLDNIDTETVYEGYTGSGGGFR